MKRHSPLLRIISVNMALKMEWKNLVPMNIRESYLEFLDRIAQDPAKMFEIQADYMNDWMHLWQESVQKFMGQEGHVVAKPEKGDRRFKAAEWQESALFDFIKQSYLLTCKHMEGVVDRVDGLSQITKPLKLEKTLP